MKKYLLTLIFIAASVCSYAQSLSFEDLLNLTTMNDIQAHDFLLVSKKFKSAGVQLVNGQNMELFKSNPGAPDITGMVLLGALTKGQSGAISRPVTYTTLQESGITSLLAQAKKSTLTLVFQGSDHNENIYHFDNSLFKATISLSFDKKWGSVEVQQKD